MVDKLEQQLEQLLKNIDAEGEAEGLKKELRVAEARQNSQKIKITQLEQQNKSLQKRVDEYEREPTYVDRNKKILNELWERYQLDQKQDLSTVVIQYIGDKRLMTNPTRNSFLIDYLTAREELARKGGTKIMRVNSKGKKKVEKEFDATRYIVGTGLLPPLVGFLSSIFINTAGVGWGIIPTLTLTGISIGLIGGSNSYKKGKEKEQNKLTDFYLQKLNKISELYENVR